METLIEFIKSGDNGALTKAVMENPTLANEKTAQGISLLQFAAYCRNAEAVQILKEHKSGLDIFEAASLGELDTVKNALHNNTELLSSYSTDGFTALGLASFFGHLQLAKALLDLGADPNLAANNAFKVAPLHSACATSNIEMAELLLKNGANVNAKQMQGVTPLHSAAHNGQTNLIQLLIDHGAEVNAEMDNGQTPLVMAQEANHQEAVTMIAGFGGK